MQPTVYASFQDPVTAEELVGALLDEGVSPEDISLIAHSRHSSRFRQAPEALEVVDAGETKEEMIGNPRLEKEGSFRYESSVGGGISTSSREDSVSSVDEMDNGQEVAERMSRPVRGLSYGSEEALDIAEAAVTGFFHTTKPEGQPDFAGENEPAEPFSEADELDPIVVPGVGLVMGGGVLATDVLGAGVAVERGGDLPASLANYLVDQQVRGDIAALMIEDLDGGGAILAVALPLEHIRPERITELMERAGGKNVSMVEP
jgi:hypothetical protein